MQSEFKKTSPKSWAITAGIEPTPLVANSSSLLGLLRSHLVGAGPPVQQRHPRQGGGRCDLLREPPVAVGPTSRTSSHAGAGCLQGILYAAVLSATAVAVRVKSKENQYPWQADRSRALTSI
jgi:hypothetical protein